MGVGTSKDEMLYLASQKGDVRGIKELRQQGASLEWKDQKGRTPLMVACSYPEGYDAAATLLQLGANTRAYKPGPEGGFPLHLAAKKGLDRTLMLLLQSGAEVLVVNDLGQTPLGLAREKGKISTVRLIEDRISLFSCTMRQQTVSAPGFLEAIASNWVYKKVWVVVIPANVDPRRPPRFELVIYSSAKAAIPATIVPLEYAKLTIARPETNDPVLVVEDTYSKTKFKLLGDKDSPDSAASVQRLFNACRGIPQQNRPPAGVPAWPAPPPYTLPTQMQSQAPSIVSGSGYGSSSTKKDKMAAEEDVALKLAIQESLKTAASESGRHDGPTRGDDYGGWGGEATGSHGGWGQSSSTAGQQGQTPSPQRPPPPATYVRTASSSSGAGNAANPSQAGSVAQSDWLPAAAEGTYNGWGAPQTSQPSSRPAANPAAPSQLASPASSVPPVNWSPAPVSESSPSAPPLPSQLAASIHYPSIDTSPLQVPAATSTPVPASAPSSSTDGENGGNSKCVICWDNPPEAVCIPCGHLAGCMECLKEIQEKKWGCPVCRAPIRETIKVYQV